MVLLLPNTIVVLSLSLSLFIFVSCRAIVYGLILRAGHGRYGSRKKNFLAFLNCKIQNLNFPLLHSCFSMDGYTGKKVVTGFGLSRGSSLSFRDVNHEDKSLQSCNRIGCSTRQSSIPRIQSTVPEKPKFLKPPFRFKNSNSSAASSSRPFSSTSNFRKYYHERHNKVSSLKEADVAESSNRQAESGENLNWQSDFHGRIETKHLMDHDRPMLQRLSMTEPSSGSNATSSSRFGKQISRRFGSAIQDTASSFLRRSSALRCASQVPKTSPPAISSSRQHKYSVNNIGCASISDVLPSDSSSGFNTRGVSVRRKLQDGEGSSKAILAQPEQQPPQETSRQTRIQNGRDIAVSSGIRRGSSVIQNRRMRLSEPEYESIQLVDPLLFPQPSHAPLSAPDDVQESSQRSFSSEMPSTFYDSSFTGRPGTSSRSSQTRLLSGSEDRDDYRRFNIEGIAEILLALERIEQEEELTDEQLLVLEANLFLGGLNYYDQHRDMRLDIDNMSYEELLALEEEMGTVSTALSEEAISKCLKRSIYRSNFTFPRNSHKVDDVKCSICQEEYVIGEEMGSLPCEHRFHVECIRQWLRLKNWCPICKAAAADSFKNKTHS